MFTASTTDLYFALPHNRVITNTVKLTNKTGFDAIIKMHTTGRDRFHVRPRIFSIPNGQSVDVSISNRRPTTGGGPGSNSNNGNSNNASSNPSRTDSPTKGAAGGDITNEDECHAVIHSLAAAPSSSSSPSSSAGAQKQLDPDTPAEQLRLLWEGGSPVGRVVLKCHVKEPPHGNHFVTYHSTQQYFSASRRTSSSVSPSTLGRVSSSGDFGTGAGSGLMNNNHNRSGNDGNAMGGESIRLLGGNNNNGRPPLAARGVVVGSAGFASDASVAAADVGQQYANDPDINSYRTGNNSNNSGRNNNSNNNNKNDVEQVATSLSRNEKNLQRSVDSMSQSSAAAHAASVAVSRRTPGIVDRGAEFFPTDSSNGGGGGRDSVLHRVPLSVTVFCMMLAFIAGVLLKQAAIQHDA